MNFKNYSEPTFNIRNTDEVRTKSLVSTSFKNIDILISSKDRDWYNNLLETPYNFSIDLGGIDNQYSIVNKSLRNIDTIIVESLTLNGYNKQISYSNVSSHITSEPYLIVNVDNIDSVSYGTNKEIDKATGIMIPDTLTLDDEMNYIHFSKMNDHHKKYFRTPLASLGKMKISINNQLGNLVDDTKDVLSIYGIFSQKADSSNPATDYLVIQTSDYFGNNKFRVGNRILIQNYDIRNSIKAYAEHKDFINYINRSQGHLITHITKSTSNKLLYNRIYIPIPASASSSTGDIAIETYFSNLKTKSNIETLGEDNGGKLINLNLQSKIMFKFGVYDKEFNFNY
tara:strand:+ start:350 stop:1372 length:1023 start_codon:yes stop_codon:yes gene_type:complete